MRCHWLKMKGFEIVVLVLMLFMFAETSTGQTTKGLTKRELQNLYLNFLKEEGYSPNVDKDGDIAFKFEGGSYFIIIDEDDQTFFRLSYPNLWKLETPQERQKALVAIDFSNGETKVSKIYTVKNNVWANIEVYVSSPDQFKFFFRRALKALRVGVDNFVTKMKE